MNIKKIKPSFSDKRGSITDILVNAPMDTVTFIESKKGAVRGNHYHKKTTQYDFIIFGKMICASRPSLAGKITKKIVKTGDLIFHPARQQHAYKALEDTIFISVTKGPRRGKDYEKDVYRLTPPILK